MIYRNIKYTILSLLLAFGALTSCIDDDWGLYVDSNGMEEEGFTDGYAINLAVTLDNMGGTRASIDELQEIENYIDPEKFRVLFFDKDDKFLFESKSRWIKQLTSSGSKKMEWLVSVPMYTYGNDEDYNWNWDSIRVALSEHPFKIAILANRPGEEWCPQFDSTSVSPLSEKWFDNTGPHWGREETVWYAKKHGTKPKDVFDLHHAQLDPIYSGKSWDTGYKDETEGFYEFVAEKDSVKDYSLLMSSTSSWVDWGEKDDVKDPNGWRYFVSPSKEHPIPMYGIQQFEPIGKLWIKGTPFHLSKLREGEEATNYDFRSISLLRSVVKLEFTMPKPKGYSLAYMVMGYPNVYARCEPMDVWTPTDELWKGENHETEDCEWFRIADYGPVSRSTDTKKNSTVMDYTRRMSWFYGAWLEKGWTFGNLGSTNVESVVAQNGPSPRIFNSYVQRNNVVSCERVDYSTDDMYHFVVYTGERNVNDPTKLYNLGDNTSGAATVIYWGLILTEDIEDETKKTYRLYKIPLTSFASDTDSRIIASNEIRRVSVGDGKYKYQQNSSGTWKDGLPTGFQSYEVLVQDVDDDTPKPWPLMRNHVYRTTVQMMAGADEGYTWDFTKPVTQRTANDLDADPKWSNPYGRETVILSHEKLIDNTPGEAKVNWWTGATTTLTRTSDNAFNKASTKINGYDPIKTGIGENGGLDRQTILTLPPNKVAEKITFYSQVNKTIGFSAQTKATTVAFNPISPTPPTREFTKDDATVSGGKMFAINNYGSSMNVIKEGYFNMDSNKVFFKIELTDALAVGDVISATVMGKTNNICGLWLSPNGEKHPNEEQKTRPSLTVNQVAGAQEGQYIVKEDDELVGESVIYIYRYSGTGTQFKNFKVEPASMPPIDTYWSEVAGVHYKQEDLKTAMFTLTGQKSKDEYAFTFDPPINKITFTGGGKSQICYVASVNVKDTVNKSNFWTMDLAGSTNGKANHENNKQITANDLNIFEFGDLKFDRVGNINIYDTDPSKIRLTKETTITFPKLKEGYIITIVGESPNVEATNRGIAPTSNNVAFVQDGSSPRYNGECIFVGKDDNFSINSNNGSGKYTFKWKVTKEGEVKFKLKTGSIDFYMFRIQSPPSTSSTRAADGGNGEFVIKTENLYSKSLKAQ